MIEQIITESILIIAILILSVLLEKRVNPCIKYALWILVAVKLLIPLPEFESNISIMNIVNRMEKSGVGYFNDEVSAEKGSINAVLAKDIQKENNTYGFNENQSSVVESGLHAYGQDNIGETGRDGLEANDRSMQNVSLTDICYYLWIAGILICAGVFVRSNLRFAKNLRKHRVAIGRVKDKVNVYEAAGLKSPCLFGLFKPAIYLQDNQALSKEQREYVLLHEYTHYMHRDYLWALVRCLCVVIHWYNPLVWLAANASMKDSELACDAGTLKLIGKENNINYGKTLIEIARGVSNKPVRPYILGCSTSATGGMKEMKKRMQMIVKQPKTRLNTLFVLAFVCVSIVGCTFGTAVEEENSETVGSSPGESETKNQPGAEAENDKNSNDGSIASEPVETVQNPDEMQYGNVTLTRQAEEDKVCIRVQPSVLREYISYYYIPEGEEQEWLQNFMSTLPTEGEAYSRQWGGLKETGWQIVWQDKQFMVFEGGYLYYTYSDENQGMMEYFAEAPKLCDYIQIMLQEKLDYYSYDPTGIKDIVSARLDVCSHYTNDEYYSQTITDKETLQLFENWFSNAEYIYGGAECLNEDTCLELTLANGDVVSLSMASDSCANFGINGVYYDYRPAITWDNRELFECFDEIPWEWLEDSDANGNPENAENLLYKEYASGTVLEEGAEIIIRSEVIENAVSNPEGVDMVLNGEKSREMLYSGEDIIREILQSGNYTFYAVGQDKTRKDITEFVEVYVPADGGMTNLNEASENEESEVREVKDLPLPLIKIAVAGH